MERPEPLVSVVIPTKNRPTLLCRAVRSALAQAVDAVEVIVVIDGPSEETVESLRQINDSRLRVMPLPGWVGNAECRNIGVKAALSPWVAFLDDDDEWFPQKLERQLETAAKSRHLHPIIACRFLVRTESGDSCWPRRFPAPEEPLSEYLFCQKGLFGGEAFVASSSMMAERTLLRRIPFRPGPHDDLDVVLRANAEEGAALEFVPGIEPLGIWHNQESRRRLSNTSKWQASLAWVEENRLLLTTRAYCSFLLIQVSVHAARENAWRAFWMLVRKAFRNGRPSLADIRAYLLIWLTPKKARTCLVLFFDRLRRGQTR